MRRIAFFGLTFLIASTFSFAQVGVNIADPLYDVDIRSGGMDTFAQINLGTADNSRFLRLQSGHNNAMSSPSILWKDGDSLRFGTDLNDFTEIMRLRTNGTLYLNSALGIRLNALDMPMITRGWDPFTSGPYAGIGRWGLYMEQNFLTLGIPNLAGRGLQFVEYDPDGSIASIAMRLLDGNLGIGQTNPLANIDVEDTQASMRLISTNTTFGTVIELRNMLNTGPTDHIGSINFNNLANQTPGQILYTNEGSMIFRADGFERMRIRHGTGFLGVNTNDPQSMLDVNGDVNMTGRLRLGSWYGFPGQVLTSTGDGPPQWQSLEEEKIGFAAVLDTTISIPIGTPVTLSPFLESPGFDDGNHFDITSGIFSAPASGLYFITCKIYWSSVMIQTDVPVLIRFLVNGGVVTYGQHVSKVSVSASYGEDQSFSTLIKLNEGDQVSLVVLQDGSNPLLVVGNGGSSDTFFAIYKVY